jgi:putative transposase
MEPKRKQVHHYHDPGDCHELTFSCYQRHPLLADDARRRLFCEALDRAIERHSFRLIAFVLMPEHVHLLVYSAALQPEIDDLLFAIKRPFSFRVKKLLQVSNKVEDRKQLAQLTIQERPGKQTFRFWQEGPGYDRNLSSEAAVLASIDYIHHNPVRRGLCEKARDWKWSSARWFESEGSVVDKDLPKIHGLPWDFFCVT